MPYIKTTTTVEINEEKKSSLTKKFGEAISLVPGKSEYWLMLAFDDKVKMAFQGKDDSDYAYLEVNIFGKVSDAAFDRLTGALTEIVNEELGIDRDKIYIKYSEVDHWGWNGGNF